MCMGNSVLRGKDWREGRSCGRVRPGWGCVYKGMQISHTATDFTVSQLQWIYLPYTIFFFFKLSQRKEENGIRYGSL